MSFASSAVNYADPSAVPVEYEPMKTALTKQAVFSTAGLSGKLHVVTNQFDGRAWIAQNPEVLAELGLVYSIASGFLRGASQKRVTQE